MCSWCRVQRSGSACFGQSRHRFRPPEWDRPRPSTSTNHWVTASTSRFRTCTATTAVANAALDATPSRPMTERRTALPLPHAYPFLLLDRVVEMVPGVSAVAMKNLTRDDPLLDGDGCLPAVLLAEAMAQCAGMAVRGPPTRKWCGAGTYRPLSCAPQGSGCRRSAACQRTHRARIRGDSEGTWRSPHRRPHLWRRRVGAATCGRLMAAAVDRRRRNARLVVLGMLATACTPRAVAPPPVEADLSPDTVYAAVQRRERVVQSLRARFSARVDRADEVRGAPMACCWSRSRIASACVWYRPSGSPCSTTPVGTRTTACSSRSRASSSAMRRSRRHSPFYPARPMPRRLSGFR